MSKLKAADFMKLETKNVDLKVKLGRKWCWLCVFLLNRPGRERYWCSKHHENRDYESEICSEFLENKLEPLSKDLRRSYRDFK